MLSQAQLKEMESGGYVVFETDTLAATTLTVAKSLGRTSSWPSIPEVQSIQPRPSSKLEKSSYSGLYGFNEFPMHTDMAHWWIPPHYILLRCIQPSATVYTTVLKANDLFTLQNYEIRRAAFRPRRPVGGKSFIVHLQEINFLRWDTVFLEPIGKKSLEIKNEIKDRIEKLKPEKILLDKPGKCILIDNWNALHGRSSVKEDGTNRHIERVYLEKITGS